MSMADLSTALGIIEENPELASFAGSRPEPLIVAAEQALGLRFPPTYRRFLLEFGAGNFGGTEIYGVIDDKFSPATPPDAVACTLDERRRRGLPDELVVIGDCGGDELWCLLLRGGSGEAPVVALRIDAEGSLMEEAEELAPDFGAFLVRAVEQEIDAA
jgi:antitoxin YobK